MPPEHDLLRRMYEAFNLRDVDLVVSVMTPNIDWANGMTGGRVLGVPTVREYWANQWKQIDPNVQPEKIETAPDGRLVVDVHQVVRNLEGAVLNDRMVQHVYTLRDGLIARMDIVEV
jgi:hypothetical protein